MNFTDRLKKAYSALRGSELPLPRPGTSLVALNLSPGEIDTTPRNTKNKQLDAFAGWVYSAATTLAIDIRTNPWWIWREKGERREDWEIVPPKKLPKLFSRPNSGQTWGDLLELTDLHLELCGEAFWHLITDMPGGKVDGIQSIYPQWVDEPIIEGGRFVGWWVQIPGRPRDRISTEDILFFRYQHPKEPLMGASPVEAAALSHDIDLYGRGYGATLLKNNAVPLVVVTSEQEFTPEQADQLAERWKDRHRRRPGEPAVLGKGSHAEKLGFSLKEIGMEFIDKMSRDQIFAVYGVPAAKRGLVDDHSRANADAVEYTYQRNSLRPRLLMIDEVINTYLIPRVFGKREAEKLYYESEDPVQEDKEFLLKKVEMLVGGGMATVNWGINKLGEDKLDDGEVYLVPSGTERVPAGMLDKPPPERGTKDPLERTARPAHIMDLRAELAELRFFRSQEPLERSLKSKVRAQFSREQKAVVKAFEEDRLRHLGDGDSVTAAIREWVQKRDWLDDVLGDSAEEWRDILRGAIGQGIREGWLLFEAESDKAVDFSVFNQKAGEFAGRLSAEHVTNIQDTTRDKVRDLLAKSLEEGATTNKISSRLRDLYDGFKGHRAETIARTETASSINWGKDQAAQESQRRLGLSLMKDWVDTLDDRTRESHRGVDSVRVGQPFVLPVSGVHLMHPGDPNAPPSETVRCRCTTAYYEEEND